MFSDMNSMEQSLGEQLRDRFRPAAAGGLDASFCLMIGDHSGLTFRVRNGELEFIDDCRADATFYFSDAATADALLFGKADPLDAFMQGRFRADGYLLWAFALLAMFRGHDPSD